MNLASEYHRFLAVAIFAVLAIQSSAGTPTHPDRRPVATPPHHPAGAKRASDFGSLPLAFEPNVGQSDPRVRFLARGGGMTTFFTDTETVMVLSRSRHAELPKAAPADVEQAVVRMKLEGSGLPRRASGLRKLVGISNYFIGNDPAKWRTDVPNYGRIQYQSVYPGIDLVWYGNQSRLEYDFVVAPGADPKQIRVAYEGAGRVSIAANGDLLLHTAVGDVRQQKPRVYQEVGGAQVEVGATYAIVAPNRVSFALARYDRKRALRIDPVIVVYSTYLGGSMMGDWGTGIAVDSAGSAYVTGYAQSATFPTTQSSYKPIFQGWTGEAFITKLAPAGNTLVYSTFLGGSYGEEGHGIAVDDTGAAYVTGRTQSSDFPTVSAYQSTFQGGIADVFVTKLAPAGNALSYSTYLGGNTGSQGQTLDECGYAIAVDAAGSAYVTGDTQSTNFPTQSAYQSTFLGGSYDAFVTKLMPAGNTLAYSTYLGGDGEDHGSGIAVDTSGSAYVTGWTRSTSLPTVSAYQSALLGSQDAFVTKLSPAGNALLYSTYLGGTDLEWGYGIAVDGTGSAYVAGETTSTNFPTQSAYQATLQRGADAFVTKLTPAGNSLSYSTYLGGTDADVAEGIALDATGSAYVTGYTASTDFPTLLPYPITFYQWSSYPKYPLFAAFVTKLAPEGSILSYSTFLYGSSGLTFAAAIAVDGAGAAYIAGRTYASDFPVQSPFQATNLDPGEQAVFVTKLEIGPPGPPVWKITKSHYGNFTATQTGAQYTIVVKNDAPVWYSTGMVTVTDTMPSGLTATAITGSGWDCKLPTLTCTRSDSVMAGYTYDAITVTVTVAANATSPQVNRATVSGGTALASADVTDSTTIMTGPALTVAKSHLGNFTRGQKGAVYTVTVSNTQGALPTSGEVAIFETPPAGMTVASMDGGPTWTCAGTSCSTTSVLNGGSSYPTITVKVDIASNAGTPLSNGVWVSGGGSPEQYVEDSTVIADKPPSLTIAKVHAGNFLQGRYGAYAVTVGNTAGAGPTSGVVSVTETLPPGLSMVSMAGGPTWNCTALPNCTTSSVLAAGSTYPPIAVTVSVASDAASPLVNQASVSVGGLVSATIGDSTLVFSECDTNQDGKTNLVDIQGVIDEALGKITATHELNQDAAVNVVDAQIVINAALILGCSAK